MGLSLSGVSISGRMNARYVSAIQPGEVWVDRSPADLRPWQTIAMSDDGTKLFVADNGAGTGLVYRSLDSGANWSQTSLPATSWRSVTSSDDGARLGAVGSNSWIWLSDDSGSNWYSNNQNLYTRTGIATNSTGTKWISIRKNLSIMIRDYGETWTQVQPGSANWECCALSEDGTKLFVAARAGLLWTSGNSGGSWTSHESSRQWYSVASSSDGVKLVAAANGGGVFTSNNSGTSWSLSLNNTGVLSCASSADGSTLIAGSSSGTVYVSTDSGTTWTPRVLQVSGGSFNSVAVSSDGTKFAACSSGFTNQRRVFTSTL